MGFHGGPRSPGENLRRTQRAMGFGCGAHASLRGELGLAANLGAGTQPVKKLPAPDFGHPKAQIAQTDLPILVTQFKNDPFQADSSTRTHRETSRLLGAAFFGGSTSAKTDRVYREQTEIGCLKGEIIVGLGLTMNFIFISFVLGDY